MVEEATTRMSSEPVGRRTDAVKEAEGPGVSRAAQDRRLLIRYHRHGDQSAREELVQRLLPLARRMARRYRRSDEPLDDLIQVADGAGAYSGSQRPVVPDGFFTFQQETPHEVS